MWNLLVKEFQGNYFQDLGYVISCFTYMLVEVYCSLVALER